MDVKLLLLVERIRKEAFVATPYNTYPLVSAALDALDHLGDKIDKDGRK